MLQNFEVITPLFEGQVNERIQFKLNIEGNDYRGIFHEQEVQWFQPQPHTKIEKNELDVVESSVRDLMTNRIVH
ncbi:hypothetical protein [Sporosarcina sp. NPDC096371]|uniref:hypothetical protein n=1 Tax=Sporosarcina sp. NPDC096371 TaxID=3364530 RepID=UPI003829C0DE